MTAGPEGRPPLTTRLVRAALRLAPRDFRERRADEVLRVHRERLAAAPEGPGGFLFRAREVAGALLLAGRLRLGSTGRRGRRGALDGLAVNLRLAPRVLRRHPGHAWTVVAVLALGVGAGTAVFATANAYLFRPLPFADAERLVTVFETNPDIGWAPEDAVDAAPANVLDWRERVRAFDDVAMYSEFVDRVVYDGGGEPALVAYTYVSGNFFELLGGRPLLGRAFRWEETWAEGPRQDPGSRIPSQASFRPVVLSHGLWQRMFGGDPSVVGRVVDFGAERAEVVGVMPASFRFPSDEVEMWLPYGWDRAYRDAVWFRRAHFVRPVARLAPGVTEAEAAEQLQAVVASLQGEYPETNEVMGAVMVPFRDFLTRDVRGPLGLLLGAAGLLLALAAVNVATLSLVRAGDRSREVAVRSALGAGRGRVAGLILAENGVLAALGGALGLGVGWLAVEAVAGAMPLGIDGATAPALDGRVVAAALGATLACAAVAGGAALVRLLAGDVRSGLRDAGRRGTRAPGHLTGARALVAAEVALTLLLLVGAGLMLRTTWLLRDVDPGFRMDGVVAAELTVPESRYPDRDAVLAFQDRLVAALEARPGVTSAGIVGGIPLAGPGWSSQFQARGWPADRVGWNIVHRRADRGYFETLGIPLLRGRHLDPRTGPEDPLEIVINETFVREHFPGEDPLGQEVAYDRAATDESTWYTIVGIVGDQHQVTPGQPPRAEAFEHRRQDWARGVWVVAGTRDGAADAAATIRAVLAELDPGLLPQSIRSLRDVWERSMARETLILRLMAGFALAALLLAGVGIYGVTARLAHRRTREIGIRMALGAAAENVLGLVLRQGMAGVAAGLLAGLGGALVATRAMESVLYGVEPSDPATLLGVTALLAGVAAAACWIPARRAARTDPAESLRSE